MRTSLEGWGATWTYRTAYSMHMAMTSLIILVQPLIVYAGICKLKMAALTTLVNLPFLLIRQQLHTWEDAEAAQRVGAPLQVAYCLCKPALLIGLATAHLGKDPLPILSPDIVRIGESCAPMLLLLDGVLFATLGLSVRSLALSVVLLEGNVLAGTFVAVVPDPDPTQPPLGISTLGTVLSSLGLFVGAALGHILTSAFVERESAMRLQQVHRRPGGNSPRNSGREGAAIDLKPLKPQADLARTASFNYSSSQTGESPAHLGSGSGDASGRLSGSERRSRGESETAAPVFASDSAARSRGFQSGASSETGDSTDVSTITGFMRGSDAVSLAGSVESSEADLAQWEAQREAERAKERQAEMAEWAEGSFGRSEGGLTHRAESGLKLRVNATRP